MGLFLCVKRSRNGIDKTNSCKQEKKEKEKDIGCALTAYTHNGIYFRFKCCLCWLQGGCTGWIINLGFLTHTVSR